MIRHIDYWIGTRLFHPPIIWLCQRTGMSQWAVAAYAWLAATFTLVMRIRFSNSGEIILAVVITLLALLQTVGSAVLPDMPRGSSLGWRLIIWGLTFLAFLDLALAWPNVGSNRGWSLAWDVFALIGEYARTIGTIPPRKRRERRMAVKEAFR